MSTITTHILDTALGKPASGVAISLEAEQPGRVVSGFTG
ncbi:hydroxyisourate hydrolase [Pantoea agglomerans]|uniref:Hydroxyisourate hydrolase n=1 Tax=Enterobacter agglomerans TaxID=549 RepID=A0A379AK06_ENTAG|nr:hydroxyisourate hydrolase [Pantoea agglomerans]